MVDLTSTSRRSKVEHYFVQESKSRLQVMSSQGWAKEIMRPRNSSIPVRSETTQKIIYIIAQWPDLLSIQAAVRDHHRRRNRKCAAKTTTKPLSSEHPQSLMKLPGTTSFGTVHCDTWDIATRLANHSVTSFRAW